MARYRPPELIERRHATDAFDCGSPAQTQWLRRYALIAQASGTSRVWVTTADDSMDVVGYYALAAGAIGQGEATERVRKGTGAYVIPAILLARLGVDTTVQGQGVGRSLVVDALRRLDQAADVVGVRVLLIHAESEAAKAFYLRHAEFEKSPTDPLHLLLLLKDLRKAFA